MSPVDAERPGARLQAVESSRGFAALLDRKYRLIMTLALGLPLLQQFGGINSVIFYSADILRQCGIESPARATSLIGLVSFVVTLFSASLTDSCGRKPLLVVSHAVCGAALLALALTIMIVGASSRLCSELSQCVSARSLTVVPTTQGALSADACLEVARSNTSIEQIVIFCREIEGGARERERDIGRCSWSSWRLSRPPASCVALSLKPTGAPFPGVHLVDVSCGDARSSERWQDTGRTAGMCLIRGAIKIN